MATHYRKYTPCGGISLLWLDEQQRKKEERQRRDYEKQMETMIKNMTGGYSNNDEKSFETLEDKFNFLKAHSDNPEDLELAKQILGIK